VWQEVHHEAETMAMKIATWNVNSIRSRLERVVNWTERVQPDVMCFQEIKTVEDNFPTGEFEKLGYQAAVYGQKSYNGVAILSKDKPGDALRGMEDDSDDPQARLIAASVRGIRIINCYFPNGGTVGSDKWEFKLEWMKRLRRYLDRHHSPDEKLVLCGDTNVAVDEKDVANPEKWADSVLCAEPARRALSDISDWGLVDVFRQKHPDGGIYSWWDYRQLSFPKNDGLRLDYVFATEELAQLCASAEIDRNERKGSKPSDHAPVVVEFE
jgi:exodeoxyribonuclease-3